MNQIATVFCLDRGHKVLATQDVAFTSSDELIRQLEPLRAQDALIEAWSGAVCMVRLQQKGAA
jgi:hypothetical protein